MEQPDSKIAAMAGANKTKPFRVMIVDDSQVIRTVVGQWLEHDRDIEVTHTCRNGIEALEALASAPCEVIVLDVDMPDMDGLEALPKMLKVDPDLQIIMASTLTHRNAAISLKALDMGAADYLPKPQAVQGDDAASQFQHTLIEKIKTLGAAHRRKRRHTKPAIKPAARPSRPAEAKSTPALTLRPRSQTRPKILAVGSSTGGPQAVRKFLSCFKSPLGIPIVVTQHMPPMFTSMFADHLSAIGLIPCREGQNNEPIRADHLYVAPGDWHMRIEDAGNGPVIKLNQDDPVNFCRPAVDCLFESVSTTYGSSVLGVVLTGMGADGRNGAQKIIAAGGTIMAQDEQSSVVWGMPGAVALDGICSQIGPIEVLSKTIADWIKGVG